MMKMAERKGDKGITRQNVTSDFVGRQNYGTATGTDVLTEMNSTQIVFSLSLPVWVRGKGAFTADRKMRQTTQTTQTTRENAN